MDFGTTGDIENWSSFHSTYWKAFNDFWKKLYKFEFRVLTWEEMANELVDYLPLYCGEQADTIDLGQFDDDLLEKISINCYIAATNVRLGIKMMQIEAKGVPDSFIMSRNSWNFLQGLVQHFQELIWEVQEI
ncbi:hypothetical protein LOTGIDRAFT_171963 [Lottia gigantea]|uniref:Uncharacterized protein n=1 Tax=Lottia gigantea TaxID=225164 RepID=V4AYA9_LOTGI|nr:hypothetical protein LOTGIDRAFT_171963 [Lottia gigantea]ESP02563.1 hypothetical protein LOTGIDRAFT_171963 [Lottia gigantea]